VIRSLIRSTTLDLAVEGLARVILNAVKNNPGKRAYQLGLIAFGSGPNDFDCPDHKNMLTWAALCELEKRGDIRRENPINWSLVSQEQKETLDNYMAWGFEELHAATLQTLPRHRHAVFYSLV